MDTPDKPRSVLVTFPPDVYKDLVERARSEDRTATGLVRWAVLNYLNDPS